MRHVYYLLCIEIAPRFLQQIYRSVASRSLKLDFGAFSLPSELSMRDSVTLGGMGSLRG